MTLIWFCMSSSHIWFLWNGEALEEYKLERGIRQGDPLSPYLFILFLERLFHLVDIVVASNAWQPIQVSRGGPILYHLAFADDLILFAEANVEQAW